MGASFHNLKRSSRQDCYEGPSASRGVGNCRDGVQTCMDGVWSACDGQIKPGEEACNGVDDDCDGSVDQTCDCQVGTSEPCYRGPAATQNVGACHDGMRTCRDGRWTECSGDALPQTERCGDEIDNDCDTVTDETQCQCIEGNTEACYTGPASTRGIGECEDGVRTCIGGTWSQCEGEVLPEDETCGDDLDSNCNGIATEDECQCGEWLTYCPDGSCVSMFWGDPNNCGECGVTCGAGKQCCNGVNGSDAHCVDPQTDIFSCGPSCFNCILQFSGVGTMGCVEGQCECIAPFVACGHECHNLAYDWRHCGTCFHECGGGETCTNGECVPTPW